MNLALFKIQLGYYASQAFNAIWYKLGFALVYMALVPHAVAIQGLAILFSIDFICGVYVAHKTRTLSSDGMRKGIGKALLYSAFISAIAVAETTVSSTQFCTVGAIGLLAATEALSVTENLVILGLPIPYAARVLSTVSRKARSFGFHFSSDSTEAMSYARDLVSILTTHIPQLRNAQLRKVMDIYCSHWYGFMRNCESQLFLGAGTLAWERLHATMDRVLAEIRADFMNANIPPNVQAVFMDSWNSHLLTMFFKECRKTCMNETLTDNQQVERVREVLSLMLYRLSNEVQILDHKTIDPIETNATLEIGPAEANSIARMIKRDKQSSDLD